jgi:hypothetical protein
LKRERATALLEKLLQHAVSDVWPASLVEAVYLFGSYARGAVEPGDLDIAVDLRRDERWTNHFIRSMDYGRDPYTVLRQALRGRSRGVSILFNRDGHDDVPMTLLWQRSEPLDLALERAGAIAVDPAAGRAPRDAMLPCFDALDHWIPRFVREEIKDLIDDHIISVEQITLVDADIADPWVRRIIQRRWSDGSPLLRAALAALAYFDSQDIALHQVHLHGHDINERITPYYIGFELRYLKSLLRCFDQYNGAEWLEVVHPTQRGPRRTLRIRLIDREKLSARTKEYGEFFN